MTWTTRPRSDAGPLRAIRAGDGAPVLLLHGVGLRAEAWGAQIDALAPRFAVVAPDMPGHGESPRFGFAPRLSDFTDRVAAAMSGPMVVVGHSMGALIALDLAHRHGALVRGVAALNAIFRRSPEAAQAVRARAAALDGASAVDPAETLRRWFGDAASAAMAACRRWLTATDPAGYAAAYRVFAEEDGPSEAALRGIARPALFLTGAQEPNSTPAMARAMAALAPRGRAVVVAGAAHMAPMTHPAEVNAALVAFCEACAP